MNGSRKLAIVAPSHRATETACIHLLLSAACPRTSGPRTTWHTHYPTPTREFTHLRTELVYIPTKRARKRVPQSRSVNLTL